LTLYPVRLECPTCCSSEITYTCEPKCCFNHICAACYTTFEPFTEILDQPPQGGLQPPEGARDCLAPTVACARCDSVEVYMTAPVSGPQGALVCMNCHAVLRCALTNIETR
jgi:hypothetical protein